MSKRIPLNRLVSAGLSHARQSVMMPFSGSMGKLSLGQNKPTIFFDGRIKIQLGDKSKGQPILKGHFTHSGHHIDVGAQGDPWTLALPNQRFARWIHGFSWLPDLIAVTEKKAHGHARRLIDGWVKIYGDYNRFAWKVDCLSERLYYWLTLWTPSLGADKLSDIAQTRRNSVEKQLHYLRQNYKKTHPGLPRLLAAITLSLGGVRLNGKPDDYLNRSLDWLDDEIELQILSDGGHISRSPEATFKAFTWLSTLDQLLEAKSIERSNVMLKAIDRLAHMVGFFQLPDKGLAGFNGSGEGQKDLIEKALAAHDKPLKPFSYCPHMKYQRIAHGGSVLIVDTGGPPPTDMDLDAHLAPLSFNLATSAGRLIVNCSWSPEQPMHWRQAVRATAAHSTLTIAGKSTGTIISKGLRQKWLGHVINSGAENVKALRKEESTGIWLETSHDGYREATGLIHNRRLYMALNGEDLRGEDNLAVPLGAVAHERKDVPFTLRFHLHPSVKATLAQDQQSVLLIQSGHVGWRFRADASPLTLEPSFYLGTGDAPLKSQQIVIRGTALTDSDGESAPNRVRWSFWKLEGRK